MTEPDYLRPFVLPTQKRPHERHGTFDLYAPDDDAPQPAIVFIHGGPIPEGMKPLPRDWPIFQGYASTAAERGFVGVTVEHGPHLMPDPFGTAERVIADAIEEVRADPRVDADRVALWFFSGGGLLTSAWLRTPPAWLRCLAATYPLLGFLPDWPEDPRFRPAEAVKTAGDLPIVLTRVGLESPEVAATVEAFVATEPAGLTIIDVPDGHHSFDCLDHTDQSRDAVRQAFALVSGQLRG